jgi:adenylate kinase
MMNIALFGPPGVGKGTQSKRLIKKYQLVHIAPGDLLRAQIDQKTSLGKKVAQYINAGKLAPTQLVIDIVTTQLTTTRTNKGFLFDGFPRTTAQAEALEKQLDAHHMRLDKVIMLEAPGAALRKRIQSRARLEHRIDDQGEDKISLRIRTYNQETVPVADHYAQQHKLFRVNGMGTVEEVFERIVALLA